MPESLKLYGKLKSTKQIASVVNKQSLDELREQTDKAIEQIIFRCLTADSKEQRRAMELFVRLVKACIDGLDRVAKYRHKQLKSVAKGHSEWPVTLSLNPQVIDWSLKKIAELEVGRTSLTPTARGQRVNFQNHFTSLAKRALEVCSLNKIIVPKLLEFGKDANVSKHSIRFFGKDVPVTRYELENGDAIAVVDWQEKCVKLPATVTQANFEQWWEVVSGCVLECWVGYKSEYQTALRIIGKQDEEESVRRNQAMTRLRQSLKSIVGLRSKRRSGTVRLLRKLGAQ